MNLHPTLHPNINDKVLLVQATLQWQIIGVKQSGSLTTGDIPFELRQWQLAGGPDHGAHPAHGATAQAAATSVAAPCAPRGHHPSAGVEATPRASTKRLGGLPSWERVGEGQKLRRAFHPPSFLVNLGREANLKKIQKIK